MAHIRSDASSATRVYVQTAYGEPVVAGLKALGAHWDTEKKMWWVGKAKRAAVEALLVGADAEKDAGWPEKAAEDLDGARVHAQVEYKGRKYYVIAETKDLTRCRLMTLDAGFAPFWADCAGCNLVRRYEGREAWDGRRYSGKTVTQYQTIGSLRRFRDYQNEALRNGNPACAACGRRGELVEDLEDGAWKCRGCADMPYGG
jgi:ribosomal protein L37AE/L43A